MPYLTAATRDLMLDAVDETATGGITHGSLHTAFSTTGANEVTGGSPAYARKSVTLAASSGGVKSLSNAPVFDVPASATVRWIGYWTAVTAGTFRGMVPNGGGALKPFSVDDATTDVLDSPAHGFTNTQMVVVWAGAGALPAGVAEGTVYHVRDVTTDSLKLAATAGGAAIDLTTIGTGLVQRIIEEAMGAQGTITLNTASIELPF